MEVLWVTMEVLGEREADNARCVHVIWGKTEKFLKTIWDLTLFVQNTQFSRLNWPTSKSPKWVAKILWTKFWKFFLSLFHDWQIHLRESRETFCGSSRLEFPFATRPRKWPLAIKCFSWLGDSLARESRELLSKLGTRTLRLAWPASESKNRVVKNLDFLKIFKIKHFPKTTKNTQKSFCVWSTYDYVQRI